MPDMDTKPTWQIALEDLHDDEKAWRQMHLADHARAEERRVEEQRRMDGVIGGLKHNDDAIGTRLDAGATAFSEVKQQITTLTSKINWPAWKVLTTAVSVFTFAGALVWAAAKYPDRDEFRVLQKQVLDLSVEQALQRQSISEVKGTQEKMNDKLDTLLLKKNP